MDGGGVPGEVEGGEARVVVREDAEELAGEVWTAQYGELLQVGHVGQVAQQKVVAHLIVPVQNQPVCAQSAPTHHRFPPNNQVSAASVAAHTT